MFNQDFVDISSKSYTYLNVETKTLYERDSPYVKPVVTKSMGSLPSNTSWAKAQEEPVIFLGKIVPVWKINLHSSSTFDSPMNEFSGSILPDFLSY